VRYRTLEANIRANLPKMRLAETRSLVGEDNSVTLRSHQATTVADRSVESNLANSSAAMGLWK
jgi:hypothetical protein